MTSTEGLPPDYQPGFGEELIAPATFTEIRPKYPAVEPITVESVLRISRELQERPISIGSLVPFRPHRVVWPFMAGGL